MSNPGPCGQTSFYDRDTYSHERSVGALLKRVLDSVRAHVDHHLADHDLTHAQWVPLFKIAKGESDTMAALAREMCLDPGAMTRSIDRLEAKGLLQRVRSEEDRRVVKLVLTEAGRDTARRVWGVLADVLNLHLAGFDPAEVDLLMGLLERMLANGESHGESPPAKTPQDNR